MPKILGSIFLFFLFLGASSSKAASLSEACRSAVAESQLDSRLQIISYKGLTACELEVKRRKKNRLSAPKVTVTEEHFKAIQKASLDSLRMLRLVVAPQPVHFSSTHTHFDVDVQILILTTEIKDPSILRAIAFAIRALHWLDDIADAYQINELMRIDWSTSRSLEHMMQALDPESVSAEENAVMHTINLLLGKIDFYFPDLDEMAQDMIRLGIRRQTMGSLLFAKQVRPLKRATLQEAHKAEVLSVLKKNSWVYELTEALPSVYVAYASRPILEAINALKGINDLELSMAQNLLYGPLLMLHNIAAEKKRGEVTWSTGQADRLDLELQLGMVLSAIQSSPPEYKDQILVNYLPILEAFSPALHRYGLLNQYLNFAEQADVIAHLGFEPSVAINKIKQIRNRFSGR